MNSTRTHSIQILSPFFKNSKNIALVEKYIYLYSRNDEEYREKMYQSIGILLKEQLDQHSKKSAIESVLIFLHSHPSPSQTQQTTDWEHPIYAPYLKIENEQMDFNENPFEVEEGVMECGKCKSKRTISFTKQCRAADESTSVFSQCVECGNRWRTN